LQRAPIPPRSLSKLQRLEGSLHQVEARLGVPHLDHAAAHCQVELRIVEMKRRGLDRLPQPLGHRQRLMRPDVSLQYDETFAADPSQSLEAAVLRDRLID